MTIDSDGCEEVIGCEDIDEIIVDDFSLQSCSR